MLKQRIDQPAQQGCVFSGRLHQFFAKEKLVEVKDKSRNVYLPDNSNWFNFWTGKKFEGGKTISTESPIDIIPLFIKAGSIIPMGPFVQYSTEKPVDPIELRIYSGADGNFTLYEDENDNYNYEKGIYSTIDFKWNDKSKTLTIADRKGEFPGMLNVRTINVVIVKENHGNGVDISQQFDKSIKYSGKEIQVKL